ncbi:transposase [Bacillus chungangensis]|uniref:Transposase n=1 Tax=Bacillus chungangensis TaxID=587633 RepID=A0ABT9WP02_9BACI|nr:transposase [Bacillus chungangensis]
MITIAGASIEKAISEVSWSKFRKYLDYKAEWKGRDLIIAPKNYASSQICLCCGYKNKDGIRLIYNLRWIRGLNFM